MIRRPFAVFAVCAVIGTICIVIGLARADGDADADLAFRAASRRAAANEPGALDELERLGAARPVTRWSDDAWAEAARVAERLGDYARARRDLEQVIALASDPVLVRRARTTLDRLASITGAGQWDAVAREHEQLVTRALSGGDPTEPLETLEALVRANPAYPRGAAARLVIARGWEEEGQVARAFEWLHDAVRVAQGPDTDVARIALVRALLRHAELEEARSELPRIADRGAARELETELAGATRRVYIRWAVIALLLALLAAAAFVLRRDGGSWRAVGQHLRRPPIEVLYFVPIGLAVALVAQTGNPLVAHAVVEIVIAGAVIGWISGVMLEASRRGERVRRRRLAIQLVAAAIAVLASVYFVVDRTRLLDLMVETWKHGPAPR